jgi:glutamyl-tRNA synthetase
VTPEAPRLRFAPSPTGFFHVGGARTALFNWLIAQRTGGAFVLRIEDTDTERNRDEWTVGIQNAMRWVGVDWTEGPFFQSQRTALYVAAADRLRAEGKAYYCSCSSEETKARNIAKFGNENQGYDGFCRDRELTSGAVRFRTPDEGSTTVIDLIRGEPTFDNSLIEDFIIQRTNGGAMFILANVVDDIDMRITHVVRGEEHLPNTPKAILLWQALSADVALPVFAHVPVLVNEKRQKLSKRRDKVAVEDYRDLGILPEAMRNYLVLLGWAPGEDREILSVQTMIDEFRLEDVSASPAFFDIVKLTSFNAEYIRALSVDEFIERCRPWGWDFVDSAKFRTVVPFVQLRAKVLTEVPGMVSFLFDEPVMDEKSWEKTMVGPAAAMLDGFLVATAAIAETEWTSDSLKAVVEQLGETNGLKLGKAQAPIRVAVTGSTVGLPLFESLEVLGRDKTSARIRLALERIA